MSRHALRTLLIVLGIVWALPYAIGPFHAILPPPLLCFVSQSAIYCGGWWWPLVSPYPCDLAGDKIGRSSDEKRNSHASSRN